jgi:hypothetical protein
LIFGLMGRLDAIFWFELKSATLALFEHKFGGAGVSLLMVL